MVLSISPFSRSFNSALDRLFVFKHFSDLSPTSTISRIDTNLLIVKLSQSQVLQRLLNVLQLFLCNALFKSVIFRKMSKKEKEEMLYYKLSVNKKLNWNVCFVQSKKFMSKESFSQVLPLYGFESTHILSNKAELFGEST